MKIDFTKPVQTRDGRKVRILCTDGPTSTPVIGLIENENEPDMWTLDGKFLRTSQCGVDLIQAPVKQTIWLNVYNFGGCYMCYMYDTKPIADEYASKNRIACVKVEFEEGEGL